MFLRMRRLMRLLGRDTVRLWYAFRHPASPLRVKIAAALVALYVLSPIDLIPDALLLFGWIDDVAILAFVIPAILRMMPLQPLQDVGASAERWLTRWRFWRIKN